MRQPMDGSCVSSFLVVNNLKPELYGYVPVVTFYRFIIGSLPFADCRKVTICGIYYWLRELGSSASCHGERPGEPRSSVRIAGGRALSYAWGPVLRAIVPAWLHWRLHYLYKV